MAKSITYSKQQFTTTLETIVGTRSRLSMEKMSQSVSCTLLINGRDPLTMQFWYDPLSHVYATRGMLMNAGGNPDKSIALETEMYWALDDIHKTLKHARLNGSISSQAQSFEERAESVLTRYADAKPGDDFDPESDDPLILDIKCLDADGRIFDRLKSATLMNQPSRTAAGLLNETTLNNHIKMYQDAGRELMSLPAMLNALMAIFGSAAIRQGDGRFVTLDAKLRDFLRGYMAQGGDSTWYATNTLVNYDAETVIHHPSDRDFLSKGVQSQNVNANRQRAELGFINATLHSDYLKDSLLKDTIVTSRIYRFLRQVTGLKWPERLLDLGSYLGKEVWLSFPRDIDNGLGRNFKETKAVCVKVSDRYIALSFSGSLNYQYAAYGMHAVR